MGLGIGRFLGKAVKKGIGAVKGKIGLAIPGVGLGGIAAGIGSKIVKRIGRKNAKRAAVGAGAVAIGGAGVMAGRALDEGERRRYRRINPGNTRAMRRAIRRIEAGARIYSKFFSMKRGSIRGARGVRVKKLSIRRAA